MATSLRNAIIRTCVYGPSSPSGSSNVSESVHATSTHYSRREGLRTRSEPRSIADRHAITRRDCGWHHHGKYPQPRLTSTLAPLHSARASRSRAIAPEVSGEVSDDRGDLSEIPDLNPDAFGELVAVVPISNGPEFKKDPSSRYRVPSATDSRSREESREEGEKALTLLLQYLSESDTTFPDGITPPAAVDASDPEAGVQEEEGAKGWDGGQAEGDSGAEAAEESPSGWEAREDGSGNFGEASGVSSEGDSGRMWGQSGEKTMDAQRLFVGNLPFSIPSSELVEELRNLFGQFGDVEDVDMATYRKQTGAAHSRGKHRGFGFIRMSSESEAQEAMEVLHRRPFLGCILQVTPGIKKNPYTFLDDPPSSSSSASSGHAKSNSTQKSTFGEGDGEPIRGSISGIGSGGRRHCKLYVGRLNSNTDARTLKDVFSAYGKVVDAKVVCTNESKMSLGFGFVTMHDEEAAMEALKDRDGSVLDGNRIRVNLAQFPRTMR